MKNRITKLESQTQAYFDNLSIVELQNIVDDGLPPGYTHDFSDVSIEELELVGHRRCTKDEAFVIGARVKIVQKVGEACCETAH